MNPIYDIQESHLVTRRLSHSLLGEVAVIEDQANGQVLMTKFVSDDSGTRPYESLDEAMKSLNSSVIAALLTKVEGEVEKIKAYRELGG
jgi:hypothetical protein